MRQSFSTCCISDTLLFLLLYKLCLLLNYSLLLTELFIARVNSASDFFNLFSISAYKFFCSGQPQCSSCIHQHKSKGNTSPVTCDAPLPVQESLSLIRFEFLVKKKATKKEGNNITRKVGTRFDELGRVKDDYISVLSGAWEDKEEDVPPLGPVHSYCFNTTTWLRYRSSLSVPYGIKYIAKSNPCTLLDIPELIQMVDPDLPPSPQN